MEKITADSPESKSADLIKENVDRLRSLFPEAANEDGIDLEILRQLLGIAGAEGDERYGLTWSGKRLARQAALVPSRGTLRPAEEESVEWASTRNILVEGDNLEVLKLLDRAFAGAVDVIYIDPPYNTGKDFVYADDFRDTISQYKLYTGQLDDGGKLKSSNTESSGRFHTDWLNMIYPRIKRAKILLKKTGIIAISIDDNEIDNLRKVCAEIFGEENFVSCLIWEKGRKNDAKLFSNGHEYLLVYANSLDELRARKTVWREEKPGTREIWDRYVELRAQLGDDDGAIERELQAWYSALPKGDPSKKWSRYKRIDANGPWRDRDISWPGGDGPTYEVRHPVTGQPCKVPEAGWRFAQPEEMERQIKLGLVEFRADHTEPPFRKAHLRPVSAEMELADSEDEEDDSSDGDEEEMATQVRGSYFYKQSQVAVKFLKKLIGSKIFNNPKDHVELSRIFSYVTNGNPDAVFMDFFAGSGSTGHAVMELNGADGGQRRFILVQLPEVLDPSKKDQKAPAAFCDKLGKPRNIAEITKERLRRAGAEVSKSSAHSIDAGFRVFKLDTTNIREWAPDRDDIAATLEEAALHLKADRTEDDILFELLLKLGFDLTSEIQAKTLAGHVVYSVGAGTLLVCLSKTIEREMVEALAAGIVAMRNELAPAGDTQVVFRDSAFTDDVAKTNMAAVLQQHGLERIRSI